MKVWTDGQIRWLQYSPLSMSGGIKMYWWKCNPFSKTEGHIEYIELSFVHSSWNLACTYRYAHKLSPFFITKGAFNLFLKYLRRQPCSWYNLMWKTNITDLYLSHLLACFYYLVVPVHFYTPTHREGAILQSPCLSVRSHFHNRYLSFYWKKWFYIWYMALAWWLVPCLPFPGLPHIYFLFTARLRIVHVCHNENFRESFHYGKHEKF
jgi:hypothetical protein